MAPTLTATAQPAQGRVQLVIAGGTTSVRVTATAPPVVYQVRGITGNGTFYDYDAPLNTDISYIPLDASGPGVEDVVTLESGEFWLASMTNPAQLVHPVVLADREQSWAGRGVAHDVLGTPEPLVTTQVAAYRSGVLDLYAETVQDWSPVRDLLLSGDVLLLRSPCAAEIADTALLVEQVDLDLPWSAAPARPRRASVSYRSVRRDTGPPAASTWTFDDVRNTYATFAALPTVFATFDDLAIGPAPVGASAPGPTTSLLGW